LVMTAPPQPLPLPPPSSADVTKSISKAYGVLVEDPSDDMAGLALRGTFIVDGKGVVRNVTVNDAPVGRSVEETLRLVSAFQYTDTHGEVCPAGWKPGARTMIPDPVKSKEYFAESK
jgi:alkyl hydroperoxide reductase subunit AhpC